MIIYIAAPYEHQAFCRELRSFLQSYGFEVGSRWLEETASKANELQEPALRDMAWRDIADVQHCDILLVYNPPDFHNAGTGGRHTELGFALQSGKVVILFGEKSQIFHQLVTYQVHGYEQLVRLLNELRTWQDVKPAHADPAPPIPA